MSDTINLSNAQTASQGFGVLRQIWRNNPLTQIPGKVLDSMSGETDEKATQNNNGGQQSLQIRIRNNEEGLQQLYPSNSGSKPGKQRASLDDVHDSFAFSPEALALMGC